jgi:hypothetical protein
MMAKKYEFIPGDVIVIAPDTDALHQYRLF